MEVEDLVYEQLVTRGEETLQTLKEVSHLSYLLHDQARHLSDYHHTVSDVTLQPFRDFLLHNVTKMAMYEHVTSPEFQNSWVTTRINTDHLAVTFNAMSSELDELSVDIAIFFESAYNLSVIVMRDNFVSDLLTVKYLEQNYHMNDYLQSSIGHVSYSNSSLLGEFAAHVMDDYRRVVLGQLSDLSQALEKVTTRVNAALQDLEEFSEGNKLDEVFFMWVHVTIIDK